MIRYFAILAAALIFLAACAPRGPAVRPDRIEDPQRAQIEALLAEQDYAAAAQALSQLAADRPERASQLHLEAAEAWLSAADVDQAGASLIRIDVRQLGLDDQVRMDLAQAELALLAGDLSTASWLLAHSAERLPRHLEARHAALDQRLREARESPVHDALQALASALQALDFQPELALALLIEQPLADLEEMLYQAGNRPDLLPWLDLAISAREYLLDDEHLLPALAAWQRRYPGLDYQAEEAQLWIAAWRRSVPLPGPVTIVLPDRNSALYRPGVALRDGMLAGWLEITPERRPRLHFVHVADNPEAAVSAWFDAREAGSEFMIGPLERSQVNHLLSIPGAGLMSSLLLNLPEEPEVLQRMATMNAIGLLPEEEAEMAAVRALVDGHRRAIVLGQYTSWGERVSQAFADTFALGGGRILLNRMYDPDTADHSHLLTTVLEIDQSEERIRRLSRLLGQPLEAVPQRRTDVDLIFLGARAGDGRQIRPQLRFFEAGDVPLMATSQIIAGAPRPSRDRDLDGVIVPMAPWFLDFTLQGQLRAQAERLHDYLDIPTLSRLHALGRDAIGLVPWLEMMRNDPALYLPGMTGRLSLPDGRVVQRDLPFVEIVDGHARPR